MTARKFTSSDYPEYQAWFANPALAKWLGSVDLAWLEHVLADPGGAEYAFRRNGELVGVIGITYPQTGDVEVVITNIAVKPGLGRMGVGTEMLKLLTSGMVDAAWSHWRTYVATENIAARQFFCKLGWREAPDATDASMVCFYNC